MNFDNQNITSLNFNQNHINATKLKFISEYKELSIIIYCRAYNAYKELILKTLSHSPNVYIQDNIMITDKNIRCKRFTFRFKDKNRYDRGLDFAKSLKTYLDGKFQSECVILL